MNDVRLGHLKCFYDLLGVLSERIGGPRVLADCDGRLDWPQRGVYFFMESGELRRETGNGNRIVRVGTHALKGGSRTTLWKRLSQHRGQARSGGGNHRGSIFRLIVGTALIERHGYQCETWDNRKSSASREVRGSEQAMERKVSETIGAMRLLWLPVEDQPGPDSLRGAIERNSIALLSNYGKDLIDPPSPNWLGNSCNRSRVRDSGLWNANHVDESYDPGFLDTFEVLATRACR